MIHSLIWLFPDFECLTCGKRSPTIMYVDDLENLDINVIYHLHCLKCHKSVTSKMDTGAFLAICNAGTPPGETGN